MQHVQLDIREDCAFIRMDDGKVNALSTALIGEVGEALDAAEAQARVVVLRGREGIFSAGFDLKTFQRGAEAGIEMVQAGAGLVQRILGYPRPVVTACTGHAYPAGAFLMMSADVRFCTTGPWKIGMNETAIGLTVPQFAVELARHRLTPHGFARIQSASLFDPEEAQRLGYLDTLVQPEALDAALEAEVERLRGLDPTAFAGTKARINEHALARIAEAADVETKALSRA